jgi:hypothetical protein
MESIRGVHLVGEFEGIGTILTLEITTTAEIEKLTQYREKYLDASPVLHKQKRWDIEAEYRSSSSRRWNAISHLVLAL